jgi:hypothetical protein
MLTRSQVQPGAAVIAALVGLLLPVVAGCGHSSQSVAPSALAANPSTYDDQDVTVSGTAKNPTTREMRRGAATVYQLCDNACITVLQFGGSNVADGSQVTVNGHFRASFGRTRMMNNVLVVGGRMNR